MCRDHAIIGSLLTLLALLTMTGCDAGHIRSARAKLPDGRNVTLKSAPPLVIEDLIGRDWKNERVSFALDEKQAAHARAGSRLVDTSNPGRAIPYHFTDTSKRLSPTIEILVDLPKFTARRFEFIPAQGWPATGTLPAESAPPPPAATDIVVVENADTIRIGNARVGVSVRRGGVDAASGPIEALRIRNGAWFGSSSFRPGNPEQPVEITGYRARLLRHDPVSAIVEAQTLFKDGTTWTVLLTVLAGEPVVLVDEWWSELAHPRFEVNVPRAGFAADQLYYRQSKPDRGKSFNAVVSVPLAELQDNTAYWLEPWLHWNHRPAQGNWVAMFGPSTPDMLVFGALKPGDWFTPEEHRATPGRDMTTLQRTPDGLRLALPAQGRRRHWLIGTADRDTSLPVVNEPIGTKTPPPQELVIKHGDFPLELVKSYTLDWKGDHDHYPRLMVRKDEVAALRASAKVEPAAIDAALRDTLSPYTLAGPMAVLLKTGDPRLSRRFADEAIKTMQEAVDQYTKQESLTTMGFAPHHQVVNVHAAFLADAVLASDALTPEQKRRLRAQAAFLAYTTNRADYHSPERGYSANPNMTTTARTYLGIMACLVPSHPLARAWFDDAIRELHDVQLLTWADDNGGWLEAPHYAMVSYDYLLGMFLMARNAGFADHVFHPNMKNVAEWFAKISTPPDTLRMDGKRRLPAIGNTYMLEPSGAFGTIAGVWKSRDPVFASHMQWMFQQQGSWPAPGVGGFFPTTSAHAPSIQDPAIPAVAPAYTSELFPRTGAILRNHFPTERETQLLMIAGPNHDHYDDDSGSFTLWGKGKILCDDFGYGGYLPPDQHSMVDVPGRRLMNITAFATDSAVDYVAGSAGPWSRQIAMVKDADPLGPNYYVVNDSINTEAAATWRLMCTTGGVTASPDGVIVTGLEDVSLDVFFVNPAPRTVTTRPVTVRSASSWKHNAIETTQTAIDVALPAQAVGSRLLSVLFPRLKSGNAPAVKAHWGGKGVRVAHERGEDLIVLAGERAKFSADGVEFDGAAGGVLIRGDEAVLWLGGPGTITYAGHTFTSDKPGSRRVRIKR